MIVTLLLDPINTAFLVGAVNSLPNGKKTLSDPNGNVYSLQPTNEWPSPTQPKFADRPPGAAGAFEQCDVDNGIATFWYLWNFANKGETPDVRPVGPVSVAIFLVTPPAQ